MGTSSVSETDMKSIKMNMIPYVSAVGSLMSVQVQVRTYPDVVYVSGIFWQKSSLDIDHWNGVCLVILQSIIGFMLSKKEQVLSNS